MEGKLTKSRTAVDFYLEGKISKKRNIEAVNITQ